MAFGFFGKPPLRQLFERLLTAKPGDVEDILGRILNQGSPSDIAREIHDFLPRAPAHHILTLVELGRRAPDPALVPLFTTLGHEGLPEVAIAKIIQCLAAIPTEDSASLLLEYYIHCDPKFREEIKRSLVNLGDVGVWPIFNLLLTSPDKPRKNLIGDLLRSVDGERRLVLALHGGNEENKKRALEIIREWQNPELLPFVTRILEEDKGNLQVLVLECLDKTVNSNNLRYLLRFAHRLKPELRAAVETLLKGKRQELRDGIVRSLAAVAHPETAKFLLTIVPENTTLADFPNLLQCMESSLEPIRRWAGGHLKIVVGEFLKKAPKEDGRVAELAAEITHRCRALPSLLPHLREVLFLLAGYDLGVLLELLPELNSRLRTDLGRFLSQKNPLERQAFFESALNSSNRDVVRIAVEFSLGQRDLPILLKAFLNEDLRQTFPRLEVFFDAPGNLPRLVEGLEHPDSTVRQNVVRVARERVSGDAFRRFSPAKMDNNVGVRQVYLEGMLERKFEIFASEIALFVNDSNDELAIKALEHLDANDYPQINGLLGPLTQSNRKRIRERALLIVGRRAKKRFLESYDQISGDQRRQMGRALVKIEPGFIDEIIQSLKNTSSRVRVKAAQILGDILEKSRAGALHFALGDADAAVRATVVKTLGLLGDEKSFGQLIRLLADPSPRVRANVIESLDFLGGESNLVQILFPYLYSEHNRVRANTIVILFERGIPDARESLYQMLAHAEEKFRASACWAAGRVRLAEATNHLFGLFRDPGPLVRLNAVKALLALREPRLKVMLIRLKNDPDLKVRNLVRKILGG